MAQQTINNGDSGLTVRNGLNSMFTELYASILIPIKAQGVNANRIQAIPLNTFVAGISLSATSGAPTVNIGTTPGGSDLLPATLIGNSQIVLPQLYFQAAGNIYFTVSGGVFSYRIDVQYNYF
jgi:hypothetical protein